MRLKNFLALLAGVLSIWVAAVPTASAWWDRPDSGWTRFGTLHRWRYSEGDPYAYEYAPRGYYPYYNSYYWRRATRPQRHNFTLPPYYASWGAPRRNYHHVDWHNQHYGGHRRGQW